MIEITSLEGPATLGPNKYRIKDPSFVDNKWSREHAIGLSNEKILLDGREACVRRVSSIDRTNFTMVIVLKPEETKRSQCKDIDEIPILEFLKTMIGLGDSADRKNHPDPMCRARWATWYWYDGVDNSVCSTLPDPNISSKLVRAKMKSLVKRGLVGGYTIGDLGDYVITDKGLTYLSKIGN